MSRCLLRRALAVAVAALVAAACSGGKGGSGDADRSAVDPDIVAPAFPEPTTTAPTPTGPSSTTPPAPTKPAYVVDPSGNDSAAGTDQAPWKTLRASIPKLRPGDTLLLRNGTYSEGMDDGNVIIRGLNGTPQAWITIAAYPGHRPKLVGGEWKSIGIESSTYLAFEGLELVGSAGSDHKPTSGFEIRESHHIRVAGNYVHDGGGGGISSIGSNHLYFDGNIVSGMGKWNPYQTSGVSTFESKPIGGGDEDGYSIRIVNNFVYGNENITPPAKGQKITDGNCIIVDSQDKKDFTGTTLVANNVCYNNGGRGVHVFHASNVLVTNNTLYRNVQSQDLRDNGELSAVFARNVTFSNNLVIPRSDRKEVNVADANGIVFTTNLYAKAGASKHGDGDIVAPDAGLSDPSAGRFALVAGSPAVDAGLPKWAPTVDVTGTPRVGAPDIGAYELVRPR
jgi:parallel beta-helix repeat protein